MTSEKLGDGIYAAILRGEGLETIAAAGWDSERSLPVPGIPTPLAGRARKQSLRIAVPWPSPEPRAPIFVWLRGETAARPTTVRY